jgi:glutamyl-Q tRNA(Asp) synthetase
MNVTGRFAPSPTGPLHFGSLVAAVGSYLFARRSGGRWLVRMEDLDTPRQVAGSAEEILTALERYGLEWDGEVVAQSARTAAYEAALARLEGAGLTYPCGCSRADLRRAASAPDAGDGSAIYLGTCRAGLAPGKVARALRFRSPDETIAFDDAVFGRREENVARTSGDFVLKRADGIFAYQLAVVVDDAAQGVTEVVRGADLLESTPRQIALQRALGLPTPRYAHLPLVVGPDGGKLGKRYGALPLPQLDDATVVRTLTSALQVLGFVDVPAGRAGEVIAWAVANFDPARVKQESVRFSPGG